MDIFEIYFTQLSEKLSFGRKSHEKYLYCVAIGLNISFGTHFVGWDLCAFVWTVCLSKQSERKAIITAFLGQKLETVFREWMRRSRHWRASDGSLRGSALSSHSQYVTSDKRLVLRTNGLHWSINCFKIAIIFNTDITFYANKSRITL